MSHVVVKAQNVRKEYRLYRKPHLRLLDLFGLLRQPADAYTTHPALDGVNLEIRRGEKVAFIGRNGAGKSTLLKTITKVTEPTSGTLEVRGKTHALLQIGTGFHPEFTGRENVFGYLAHLGISGAAATQKLDEIVDFTELEEYIDQPIKTYSTGMAARLMFATSTAISPDILVLDEVLGVGDAYFTQKSFERIRNLCDSVGTTTLLVSHDIYSASKLCERMIWIDRGKVVFDDESSNVIRAYEDSIRQQEELRLRKKKQEQLRKAQDTLAATEVSFMLVEFSSKQNRPQACPIYFSRIALVNRSHTISEWPLGDDAAMAGNSENLVKEATSWGAAATCQGRQARPMLNYGSPFHKVAGVFRLGKEFAENQYCDLEMVVEYYCEQPCELVGKSFIHDTQIELGTVQLSHGAWREARISFERKSTVASSVTPEVNDTGVQGSGKVLIKDVRLLGEDSTEKSFVEHGSSVTFEIDFALKDPSLSERLQLVVAVSRDGLHRVCRYVCKHLSFDATSCPRGTVVLNVPKLSLGLGQYTVAVVAAREGYFDEPQTVFYSINPGVYYAAARVLEFEVTGSDLLATNTGVVGEGDWQLKSSSHEPAEFLPSAA